jgi:hypothetical protein
MLFAMAVPSILAPAIADPEKVRNGEMGLTEEKSTLNGEVDHKERGPLGEDI